VVDQILVLSDESEVTQQIDFIETDREGIYVYFIDGKIEFHPWKNKFGEER